MTLTGKTYCVNHLIEDHRQSLAEQENNSQKHSSTQPINTWQTNSIDRIRQAGEEARQLPAKQATESFAGIEIKLTELTGELKINREGNDFNELHIYQFKQKLKQLEEQRNTPANISLREVLHTDLISLREQYGENMQFFLTDLTGYNDEVSSEEVSLCMIKI